MNGRKRVCIVHGYTAHCTSEWFPWLKAQLEKQGISTVVPELPDSDTPRLSAWLEKLNEEMPRLDQNTVLVGHSLGCVTALQYLLRQNVPVRGIVLVSGFIEENPLRTKPEALNEFVSEPLDVQRVKRLAPIRLAVTALDDDVVPTSATQEMAKKLDAELTVLNHGGHLIKESGYAEFPLALQLINQIFQGSALLQNER